MVPTSDVVQTHVCDLLQQLLIVVVDSHLVDHFFPHFQHPLLNMAEYDLFTTQTVKKKKEKKFFMTSTLRKGGVYLVLERDRVPALPRLATPRVRSAMEGCAGALGVRAFSLKLGSTQQGAAGKPLICLFSCRRTATTSRHLVGKDPNR